MAGFVKSLYHLADSLAGTPATASSRDRARARGLVVWTMLAVPIGGLWILLTQGFNLFSPSIAGLALGCFGMIFAVRHLRAKQDLDSASVIFLASVCVGLGFSAWFEAKPSIVPLIFLAVTPVYFGLIADWQQCLRFTIALASYFLLLAGWHSILGQAGSEFILGVISCALATVGGGLSTTAFAYTMVQAARKVIRQNDEIAHLALTDSLTGIYNRRAFNDLIGGASASDTDLIFAMVDLDRFKAINDRYGHEAGDEVLIELASRLTAVTPEDAKVFRVGGDEFAVVIDAAKIDIAPFAEALCAVSKDRFQTSFGPMTVKVSVGVSTSQSQTSDLKRVYYEADIALFEVKRGEGSSWACFTDAMGEGHQRKRRLSERLKIAIERSEIGLALQPQFNIQSDTIVGFEALARWSTDEFGTVAPNEFVAIAEESGLIIDLDRAIFKKAIASVESWLSRQQTLSINVSGQALLSEDFVGYVERTVQSSTLAFEQIQIEITETQIIDDRDAAVEICREMRSRGIAIALDDFGTGYSSLSYLSSLPINVLKVDRSFVRDCNEECNLTIIRSIVGLAQSLSMQIMVEGVEEEWQLQKMAALGCENFQGFYFSRPLAVEDCICFAEGAATPAPLTRPAQWQSVSQAS